LDDDEGTHEPPGLADAPPPEALRWVADCVGAGASVEAVSPLAGATSSSLHAVTVAHGGGVLELVLRRFVDAGWLASEPDLAPHEASSLRKAARAGVPTPELVALDEDGSRCGVPATLTTLLPGRVELQPQDFDGWARQLAEAAAHVHALGADDHPWAYFPYVDPVELVPPRWSEFPEKWEQAIEVVRGPRPPSGECFIHRDYHPNNVLWRGPRLSGVVDWVNACRGAAGFDVAWCRLNLAKLRGVAAADEFLSAYQSAAGAGFEYDPYWDLMALAEVLPGPPDVYSGWTAHGVSDLHDGLMRERVDAYLSSLVARL
jgi:aminoglycoside phosphotransferase (APT) family kinase protein